MTSDKSLCNSGKTIKKIVISIIFFGLFTSSIVAAQSDKDIPVWTGNTNPKTHRNYNDFIQKLYSISDNAIKIVKTGSVYYDDVEYPIFALSYTPPKEAVIRVFLAAGQHGNEPASADAVINLFKYISNNKDSYKDIAVDAIPMLNPWGWVNNIRFNGGGHDTNRDFKRFSTQEARVVKKFVQGKTYDYMIDHHESPADGVFIFNYDEDMFDICNDLMNFLRAEGYGIGVKGYYKDRILINGINDIPSRRRARSTVQNTTGQSYWSQNSTIVRYFMTEFNAYGFTLETSTHKIFKNRVECHFDAMKFMINAFRNR
ncbi:MAG: hypothetical protein JXJ04_20575 [Spirochaetales bacterium]|nr:hypothetical protein [Spirochaetales bacterium]